MRSILNIFIGIILITCCTVICSASESPDLNDPNRYLNAVREFADNVLQYGRDTYGPKHTPLFVDGLNIHTHEPVKWIAPNGDRWILSNLASQQNLFRTLDGLTRITGDPKYKQAAMDAIKYAFENLRSPNGLLYWGGHAAYDAGADKPCGKDVHELKANFPYYELMWEIDPQATRRFIETFWSAHILDWSNLDMNRHSLSMNKTFEEPWKHEYEGGPVFFKSKGWTICTTGSDLYYAAAILSRLSGDKESLIWSKRLAYRYVETRNPKTGIGGLEYAISGDMSESPLADDFSRHPVHRGAIAFYDPAWGDPLFRQQSFGDMTFTPGVTGNPFFIPHICELTLGEILGPDGQAFQRWALEELTSYGKAAYRKGDNAWIPMFTDGTSLEGYVVNKDCNFWLKGTVFRAFPADCTDFWAYTLAFGTTGDEFMWEMSRNIGRGNGFGDIGATPEAASHLSVGTDCSHPHALLGFLSLYKKTHKGAFREMAKQIGENILAGRFHEGFFEPTHKHIYAKFDAIEPLVLLYLHGVLQSDAPVLPTMLPTRSYFEERYRKRREQKDSELIYVLTESPEPPMLLDEAAAIGDLNLVKMLVAGGADVRGRYGSFFMTPLHCATMNGHRDVVAFLISKGVEIDAKDNWPGRTALDYAVENGHKEIVELLIAQGANINAKRGYPVDDRPLHSAARAGRKDVVELLIKKGADVNAKNKDGQTPIDVVGTRNRKEIIDLLRKHGAKE